MAVLLSILSYVHGIADNYFQVQLTYSKRVVLQGSALYARDELPPLTSAVIICLH